MDDQAKYAHLKALIQTMPEFRSDGTPLSSDQSLWLGRASAIVAEVLGAGPASGIKKMTKILNTATRARDDAAKHIAATLYEAFAVVELKAAPSEQGAFIPAQSPFEALKALNKILQRAAHDLLIVDPYLDEKVLTEFAVQVEEKIAIRLLSDESTVKPSLAPAAARWAKQYASVRPLAVKLAPARTLHDRLLIADSKDVWVLTQSLNAFAQRSAASIVKVDSETADLKIQAYLAVWQSARSV